jgi:hypothetical protein
MSRSSLRLIAVALAALAGPTACGDSEPKSDADSVKQVVERFNDAVSGGDYGAACDLLLERRREQLEFERDKSCSDILEQSTESNADLVKALGKARVTIVRVTGDSATAEVEGSQGLGPGRQAILEKADGSWRITEPAIGLL